jgi:hypothetical protein
VNRRNRSCFSISVICLLSADWVRFNLRAALVKFSSSPKAMTACKWRTSTLGNTAPTPTHEFGDTRNVVLPFMCEATSGYELGTRRVLESFPRANKYLNHLHLKPAPGGGSRAPCATCRQTKDERCMMLHHGRRTKAGARNHGRDPRQSAHADGR